MKYSKEFIEKCKQVYPDWIGLHQALSSGSEVVGRYLCDAAEDAVDVDEILAAKSLEEVRKLALNAKSTIELYNEWNDLYGWH